MFDPGRKYRITTIAPSSGDWVNEVGVWTALECDGTLLRMSDAQQREIIVNTASWRFVSAELA
jgi:hypothetical protein